MAIDWSSFAIPKVRPSVLVRKDKQRAEKSAWRKTAKAVDKRDEVDGSPVCFITGKRLQASNQLDEWTFRDRAHLEKRSQSKSRRYTKTNVLSVCRAAHKLIETSALLILNKRGLPAKSVRTIDHVMWNRRMVPKGSEPCRLRKGLAVREMGNG